MVQIFLIEATGETKELGIGGKQTVGEFLDTKEVFIIVDDISHKCFLWKGKDSRIRSKFIGAKKSQDVRGQVGLAFKVEPVDEDEEPEDFKACLKNVPVPGYAKEIREEGEGPKFLKDMDFSKPEKIPTTPIVSGTAGAPPPATAVAPPAPAQKAYATSVDNVGPLYKGKEDTGPIAQAAAAPPADYTKIMDTLTGLETPMGYEREMVIIGSQTFSIVEKATMFLGQRVVKKAMEPIGSLPEGVFFAEGYAPRVLCENGKVLAIEFLKKVKGAADRVPSAARPGALPSSKPIPALPAATARPSTSAATAAPTKAAATPMAATVTGAASPKQTPPPPRLPGQQPAAPAATGSPESEGPTVSLKDHLAKMGSQDLKKAFGIRVATKKEEDKK